MSTLDNLTAAVNDMRALVAAAIDRIQNLSHTLAYAQTETADAAAIAQIAAELQAAADQLRGALSAPDPNQPHA